MKEDYLFNGRNYLFIFLYTCTFLKSPKNVCVTFNFAIHAFEEIVPDNLTFTKEYEGNLYIMYCSKTSPVTKKK